MRAIPYAPSKVKTNVIVFLIIILATTVTLCGCSQSDNSKVSDPAPDPVLTRIEVDVPAPTVASGTTSNLTATGVYADGTTKDVTNDASWSSADGAIVAVADNGSVTAVSTGSGQVTASVGDVSGATQLHVNDATLSYLELAPLAARTGKGIPIAVNALGHFSDSTLFDLSTQATWSSTPAGVQFNVVGNRLFATSVSAGEYTLSVSLFGKVATIPLTVIDGNLLGIDVTVSTPTIGVGASSPISAVGYLSDGSSLDVTAVVKWSRSSALASLDVGHAGPIVRGESPGTVVLTASFNGVSGSKTVTVSDALLLSIQIKSDTDQMLVGQSLTLTSIGSYNDGSRRDITQTVLWSSSVESIHVSNATALKGRVTASEVGTTEISASSANITAKITLHSVRAAPVRLEISPVSVRLPINTQLALIATATYADGTTRDVTADSTWESSDNQKVNASNSPRGIASALAVGEAVLTAHFDTVVASVAVTVTHAVLDSIEISPRALILAKGTRAVATAMGNFSDGSTLNVSNQAQWQIDGPALVLAERTHDGYRVVAQNLGTSTLLARIGAHVGSTSVRVTNAVATEISLQLTASTLAAGTSTPIQASAKFSDGSTQILGDDVSWTSSEPLIASVKNVGDLFKVRALVTGASLVTASYGELRASQHITVTPATLSALTISGVPTLPSTRTTAHLHVIGLFTDNSTQDLTADATWSSSNALLTTVSNASTSKGLLSFLAAGVSTITASLSGVAAHIDVTAVLDPIRPISIAMATNVNFILSNDIDASIIRVAVKAADDVSIVADGTIVNFSIEQGIGTLNKTSGTTVGGKVDVRLTSNTPGLVVIRATIADSTLSNTASVYAATDFSSALLRLGFFTGEVIDNVVQVGSQFGYLVINVTNRTFNTLSLQVFNGQTRVNESSDPSLLSDGALEGGTWMGVVVSIDKAYQNDTFVALYVLNDPSSNKTFAPALAFRLPANVQKLN